MPSTVSPTLMQLCKTYTPFRDLYAKSPAQCIAVVQAFLQQIDQNKALNAFVRVYAEEACAQAEAVAKKLSTGKGGPLAGMAVSLKDLFCYKDHPVQASSRILAGFQSQITATCVARLAAADAIILGHVNGDEFGMGTANENSMYGRVSNAIDPNRTAGGSSGGSAVAVQANMCHISLGTDTGGSSRLPAAFCGVVGFKPTYSRISRYGIIAYASSFDTVGIFANSVADCASVLQVMAGEDAMDNTSARRAVPDYQAALQWQGTKCKIGYIKEALDHAHLQPEIKQATERLLQALRQEGHEVVGIDLPLLTYALPTYYILTTAEASSNLARYDGMRYGHRATGGKSLQAMMAKTRTEGFGREVKRRLLLGAFVLDSDYHDTYYNKAQRVRRLIKEAMEGVLKQYDYIVLPTTPTTAFPHGSSTLDPITQYVADFYTVPASVAGLPAISIPNGTDQQGLPIGVQVIGSAFQEDSLLAFAQYLMDRQG